MPDMLHSTPKGGLSIYIVVPCLLGGMMLVILMVVYFNRKLNKEDNRIPKEPTLDTPQFQLHAAYSPPHQTLKKSWTMPVQSQYCDRQVGMGPMTPAEQCDFYMEEPQDMTSYPEESHDAMGHWYNQQNHAKNYMHW